jgi:hypothetical protein
MEVAEKVFLELIKNYNSKDISFAIDKNINLIEMISHHASYLIKVASTFSFFYKSRKSELTTESFLNYLKYRRPDLYSVVISSPKGRLWVSRNINSFKRLVFK